MLWYCSNSARFLWKSIPSSIKETQPEVTAVWKIGQQLWLRNYSGVHEAIRGFEWSQELQGFVAAFSGKAFKIFCFVYSAELRLFCTNSLIFTIFNAWFYSLYLQFEYNFKALTGWTVIINLQLLFYKPFYLVNVDNRLHFILKLSHFCVGGSLKHACMDHLIYIIISCLHYSVQDSDMLP